MVLSFAGQTKPLSVNEQSEKETRIRIYCCAQSENKR